MKWIAWACVIIGMSLYITHRQTVVEHLDPKTLYAIHRIGPHYDLVTDRGGIAKGYVIRTSPIQLEAFVDKPVTVSGTVATDTSHALCRPYQQDYCSEITTTFVDISHITLQ